MRGMTRLHAFTAANALSPRFPNDRTCPSPQAPARPGSALPKEPLCVDRGRKKVCLLPQSGVPGSTVFSHRPLPSYTRSWSAAPGAYAAAAPRASPPRFSRRITPGGAPVYLLRNDSIGWYFSRSARRHLPRARDLYRQVRDKAKTRR